MQARFGRILVCIVGMWAMAGLSGCGGDDDTPMEQAEAANRYEELTDALDPAFEDLATVGDADVAAVSDSIGGVIEAVEVLNEGLRDEQWPESVRVDVSSLIEADERLISSLQPIEDAETVADLEAWREEYGTEVEQSLTQVTEIDNEIRTDLGLDGS